MQVNARTLGGEGGVAEHGQTVERVGGKRCRALTVQQVHWCCYLEQTWPGGEKTVYSGWSRKGCE